MRFLVRVSLGLAGIVLVAIAALPAALYFFGLSRIPSERLMLDVVPAPDRVVSIFWADLGGSGPPELLRLSPYSFFYRFQEKARAGITAPTPRERLTTRATRAILPHGGLVEGGNLYWHIANAAAYIWVGRHWSGAEAVSASLEHSYFGYGFGGLSQASMGYYGVTPQQLSVPQAAVLVATTMSPSRSNPWCRPEKVNQRARETLSRAGIDAGALPAPRPAPPDGCHR